MNLLGRAEGGDSGGCCHQGYKERELHVLMSSHESKSRRSNMFTIIVTEDLFCPKEDKSF